VSSLALGPSFLRLLPLVDVFLIIAALNVVDHEVKRVIACYVYAMLPATRWLAGLSATCLGIARIEELTERVDPLGTREIPQWSNDSHSLNSAPPVAMVAKPET
jgi:hypothetical protein